MSTQPPLYLFNGYLLDNSNTCQKNDEEQDWCNELNHYNIKCLANELFTVEGDFVDCSLWLSNPADEDTSKKSNDWHEDVVAQVVEDVEDLTNTAVRKLEVEVEYVVSQTNDDRNNECAYCHDKC